MGPKVSVFQRPRLLLMLLDREITVKGSRVSRRITATYVKDDCVLEMVLQIPDCYPLYSVDVACGKRVGVSEDRWRRGVLHIVQTCAQNGAYGCSDAVETQCRSRVPRCRPVSDLLLDFIPQDNGISESHMQNM